MKPGPPAVLGPIDQALSMGLMHDQLTDAEWQGIRIEHIQPGKAQQNAYLERYNRTIRYPSLAQTWSPGDRRIARLLATAKSGRIAAAAGSNSGHAGVAIEGAPT